MPVSQLLRRYGGKAGQVALVVGSLLLVINQHDALWGEAPLRWGSALLTYCVPFCVFLLGKRSP